VIAATREWIGRLDPTTPADAHHLLEALWVFQQHNVVNRELLGLVLASPVPAARLAARRVERMWAARGGGPPATGAPAAPRSASRDVADDGAIVVRAVVEGMRYDLPVYRVTAGTTVTIRFVNDDYTPHNLIIGTPGSHDEIGAAADRLGADGFARQFRPTSDKVLAATELLKHQASEAIEFRAPATPGDYDMLCTFPGHRHTMRAVLHVVR